MLVANLDDDFNDSFEKIEIIERKGIDTEVFFHLFEKIVNFLKQFIQFVKNLTIIEHIDIIMLSLILLRGLEIIISFF